MIKFSKLFSRKQRPEIIKIINPKIGISDEVLKELEEDRKKIFPNPIRNGNRKRERRAYGMIISYPPTKRHRQGLGWLLDDKEK